MTHTGKTGPYRDDGGPLRDESSPLPTAPSPAPAPLPREDSPPLPDDELRQRVRQVPAWRLTADRRLLRTWSFPDPLTAACFAFFVFTLSHGLDNPAAIRQHRGRVTVRIGSLETGGLTEADFHLARRLGGD